MKYLLLFIIIVFFSIETLAQSTTIAGATHITSQDITFSSINIDSGSEDMGDGCLESNNRVWFKFQPTSTGTMTITITGNNSGATGVLYTASNLSASGPGDLILTTCGSTSPSITNGQSYYLAVYNGTQSSCNIQLQSDVPLPVELSSFTIDLVEDVVFLNWETATEINNYGFEIERALFRKNETSPIQDWKVIGFVEGNGNSNSPKSYSFADENLPFNLGTNFELVYRLKQIDTDGAFKYYNTTTKVDLSSITSINSTNLPMEFSLGQNYPNPFNPNTIISYSIASPSLVKLNVYDLQGKKIASLVNEYQQAGNYQIDYNAESLTSGIYFYELKAVNNENNMLFTDNKKMILIK